MRIEVTREDIDAGIRGDEYSCPIARAVKRTFNAPIAYVGDDHVFVGCEDFSLYPSAIEFTRAFDAGEAVEPFAFDLVSDDD